MATTDVTATEPTSRAVKDAQISSLTGMRGFAALMVVVIHTSALTDYNWLGVHGYGPIALFVLSGFLLYRPFARWIMGWAPRPNLPGFTIRRVLRIFPAYWVTLHVWYFIYDPAVPDSFGDWVRDVTLVGTLQFLELTPGLTQAWSMGTELSWYIALPFLAVLLHTVVPRVTERHRLKVHVGLLLLSFPISIAYTVWSYQQDQFDSAGMWLPKYFVCFAFGAVVGLMMEAERAGATDISRGRKVMMDPWLLPLLALVFLVITTSEWAGPRGFVDITLSQDLVRDGGALGLAGTLLVISIFSGPAAPFVRLLSSRWMQATGRWSYGIYLWHMPLIIMLNEDMSFEKSPGGLFMWFLLVVPISYVLGAMSYAWVEAPAMQWAKKLSRPYETLARPGARRRGAVGPVVAEAPEMRDAVEPHAPVSDGPQLQPEVVAPGEDPREGQSVR